MQVRRHRICYEWVKCMYVHVKAIAIHNSVRRSVEIYSDFRPFINPRRACAARVTVLGLCVCLSVCLSICLSVCLSVSILALQATT